MIQGLTSPVLRKTPGVGKRKSRNDNLLDETEAPLLGGVA